MNRFEIIDNEAGHERLRKLLESDGLHREWHCSLKVGEREEGLEIWARKVLPQVIPWVELNSDHTGDKAAVINGLREWRMITDTAIVTTAPGVRIYDGICENIDDMEIIPGLKTNALLPHRFDYVDGWARIGKELADMAQRTDSKVVVLENESAAEKYRLGTEGIDWPAFHKCLAQLPSDLTIWWYPAVVGPDVDTQNRMASLCESVAACCASVVFIDTSRSGPRVDYHWSVEARKRLEAVVKDADGSITPVQYFYGPGSQYWMDEDIPKALEAAGSDQVIIYPGAARWVEAAKVFVAVLGALPGAQTRTISGE